ncbi:MAG: ABC transporter substrate-binding protein [Ectothiorhodospiraceae bacterium]|nr:ABC transporter substrate-binding protein [Ectothiorhodospiraceae bacterium]
MQRMLNLVAASGRRLAALALTAGLVMTATSQAQTLNDIQWVTEEYAPYNFSENGIATGISVDVLAKIWEKLGVERSAEDIRVLPWARGYRMAQEQPDVCLFATTVTEPRRELFQFIEPLVEVRIAFVGPRDADVRIGSVDDLAPLRIGVVRDDIGEHLLELANAQSTMIRTDSARIMVRMLRGRRFEAVAYDSDVTRWNMLQEGIEPADYRDFYILEEATMGYACSKDMDPDLVAQMQSALNALIEDGTVERITRQYRE